MAVGREECSIFLLFCFYLKKVLISRYTWSNGAKEVYSLLNKKTGEVCRPVNSLQQGKLFLQNISEVLLNSPKLVELHGRMNRSPWCLDLFFNLKSVLFENQECGCQWTEGCSWCASGQGCHPEGQGQAREVGQWEPRDIQLGQMWSPPPGAMQAGHCPAGQQRCWKGPAAQQAGHGPAGLHRPQTTPRAAGTTDNTPESRQSQTADAGKWLVPVTQQLFVHWGQSGTPSTRKTAIDWREFRGGLQAGLGRSTRSVRTGCGIRCASALGRGVLERPKSSP